MKILQGGAKSTEPSDDRSYLLVRIAIVLVSDRQRKEGEKSFKCNQCDFASVQAGNLRTFKLTLEKKRTNAINATLHLHRQANWGHSNSLWRKAQKCKKCDFASVQAHNLRRELKKAYKCNHLQLSIYSGRRFERTSENSLRWKIVKMQLMLLCICTSRQFEDIFENSLWRKIA